MSVDLGRSSIFKEFETLRTKLLRGARDFFQRLEGLLEGQKDPESRLALGRAYRDVAELTNMIGSREDALAVHERALALFDALSRERPGELEPRFEVAKSSKAVGGLLASVGRRADFGCRNAAADSSCRAENRFTRCARSAITWWPCTCTPMWTCR